MKLLLFLAIAATSGAHAITTSINWTSDSLYGFRVEFAGIGMPMSETRTSPSGIWDIRVDGVATWIPEFSVLDINGGSGGTYHSEFGDFNIMGMAFSFRLPLENFLLFSSFGGGWHPNTPFDIHGQFTTRITDMPDLLDNLTWSWTGSAELSRHNVPDGGNTALLLGLGALGLAFWGRYSRQTV